MVGDHPLDIQLGREVGTYTIGVLTGHTRAEALFASGADLVLNRAVEILDLPM
jgi:phosphoglycolate phosphatase